GPLSRSPAASWHVCPSLPPPPPERFITRRGFEHGAPRAQRTFSKPADEAEIRGRGAAPTGRLSPQSKIALTMRLGPLDLGYGIRGARASACPAPDKSERFWHGIQRTARCWPH